MELAVEPHYEPDRDSFAGLFGQESADFYNI